MTSSSETILSFTDRESLTELLRRWPTANSQSKKALRLVGIPNLLQAWELLTKQAAEAADTLAENAPQVQAMLQLVNERIVSRAWHTTGWNVFEVLGRVRREDAHSDMLAWLFKPWEAHGLGDHFLQGFVRAATGKKLLNGRVYDSVTRKKISADGGIIDIEVLGDRWVLAIENKIDAAESPGQTMGYAEHYRPLQQLGLTVYGVFLTRDGKDAEAIDIFKPLSYGKLRKLLNQMQGRGDAMQLVRWFADHIRNNLEIQ